MRPSALPRFLHRLVASHCAVCHQWNPGRVCGTCISRFAPAAPRCMRCAIRVPEGSNGTSASGTSTCGACLLEPPPFDSALASVDYAYPWAGLIGRFKFNEALDLRDALADRMLHTWHAHRHPHPPRHSPPGLLLPIPLSASRLRARGYNQAWELARRLAARLRCRTEARLLLRVRDTPHQAAATREERMDNIRDAFAIEPLRRNELRGRAVTLVDDVMTTGATLAEAAHVLRQAGAANIDVWVLARTPVPTDR